MLRQRSLHCRTNIKVDFLAFNIPELVCMLNVHSNSDVLLFLVTVASVEYVSSQINHSVLIDCYSEFPWYIDSVAYWHKPAFIHMFVLESQIDFIFTRNQRLGV